VAFLKEPCPFLVFIIDIADKISGLKVTLKLFADNVKLYLCYEITADTADYIEQLPD